MTAQGNTFFPPVFCFSSLLQSSPLQSQHWLVCIFLISYTEYELTERAACGPDLFSVDRERVKWPGIAFIMESSREQW